jgi:hypothetical protein
MRARSFTPLVTLPLACAAGLALAACSQPSASSAAAARSVSPSTTLASVTPLMRERAVFAAG